MIIVDEAMVKSTDGLFLLTSTIISSIWADGEKTVAQITLLQNPIQTNRLILGVKNNVTS
jgi:hypothetical protein